ncbi:MAG TPA: hypothetical protein VMQ44_03015 [Candidatus Saccharimonadales bacterium]|nr:hypothetical protein [Candidatus Saccharimonadales bacterium]
MSKTIVVVGNSLLATLICLGLEKKIGGRVDFEIILIAEGDELVNPHLVSLFGRFDVIKKTELLRHTHLHLTKIRSVNLKERRLITDEGVINFDFLMLDQTPQPTSAQLAELREELTKLFAALSAGENIGKEKTAKIAISGRSALFWQIALAVKRDAIVHKVRRLAVEVFDCANETAANFLKANGVEVKNAPSNLPGLILHADWPMVDLGKVKGLRLGETHPLVDQFHQPLAISHALIVRQDDLAAINLISVTRALAKRFAWNILADLGEENIPKKEADLTEAVMLTGIHQSRNWLDKKTSRLIRARFVRVWEDFLWQMLTKVPHKGTNSKS